MNLPILQLTEAPSGPLSLRDRLEGEIERLIAMLDAMDGDPDLEPILADNGWGGVTDDREGGDVLDEGEPDAWDYEPSLGVGLTTDATGRWCWSGEDREGSAE